MSLRRRSVLLRVALLVLVPLVLLVGLFGYTLPAHATNPMCLPPAVVGIALCLLQTKHRQPGLPPRPCGVTRLQPGRLLGCPPTSTAR